MLFRSTTATTVTDRAEEITAEITVTVETDRAVTTATIVTARTEITVAARTVDAAMADVVAIPSPELMQ